MGLGRVAGRGEGRAARRRCVGSIVACECAPAPPRHTAPHTSAAGAPSAAPRGAPRRTHLLRQLLGHELGDGAALVHEPLNLDAGARAHGVEHGPDDGGREGGHALLGHHALRGQLHALGGLGREGQGGGRGGAEHGWTEWTTHRKNGAGGSPSLPCVHAKGCGEDRGNGRQRNFQPRPRPPKQSRPAFVPPIPLTLAKR